MRDRIVTRVVQQVVTAARAVRFATTQTFSNANAVIAPAASTSILRGPVGRNTSAVAAPPSATARPA
jgi:hypothetical protein